MTEKQIPWDYWFHAIQHLCRMTNQIPDKIPGKLTTPFGLFHYVAPKTCTWFPLFSIAYLYKELDNDKGCTTFNSKAMIGIAVGRSTKTNALSIYDPITKQYYNPYIYKFDPSTYPVPSSPNRSTMMGNYTLTSTATATKTPQRRTRRPCRSRSPAKNVTTTTTPRLFFRLSPSATCQASPCHISISSRSTTATPSPRSYPN